MPLNIDKDTLYDLYITKHMKMLGIAKMYGFTSRWVVREELSKHGMGVDSAYNFTTTNE